MNLAETLQRMIDALNAGEVPQVAAEELPCFSPEALAANPLVKPDDLAAVLQSLTADDVPTLQRALRAYTRGEQAWLGFKVVTDGQLCVKDVTDDSGFAFGCGSADALPGVFFADIDRQLVAARPYSDRDRFQMHDVTSGPAMHDGQFPGVTWLAIPLFEQVRVMVFGAGEVSRYIAEYAIDCGFDVVVLDDDPGFLTQERFPRAQLQLIDFADIDNVPIPAADYVCVVTRGHVHDPKTLTRVLKTPPAYVGMMGHVDKVARNFQQAADAGIDPALLQTVHAPIGVKCGAMMPAEIAVSIVAELIATRHAAVKARLA